MHSKQAEWEQQGMMLGPFIREEQISHRKAGGYLPTFFFF
jgi:hypothetical protein